MEIKRKKIISRFFGMLILRVLAILLFISNIKYFNLSFLIAFLVIVFLDFIFTIRKYRGNIKQIDYSIKLMKDDMSVLVKEIDTCIFNPAKEYLLTKHYYVDLSSYLIVRFVDVVLITKKIGYELYGIHSSSLCQYIYIITKDNIKLKVLSWTFRRLGGEEDTIFELFKEKCPDVLIDLTNENKEILKEKYNINC